MNIATCFRDPLHTHEYVTCFRDPLHMNAVYSDYINLYLIFYHLYNLLN
jgi:hypothetical protein